MLEALLKFIEPTPLPRELSYLVCFLLLKHYIEVMIGLFHALVTSQALLTLVVLDLLEQRLARDVFLAWLVLYEVVWGILVEVHLSDAIEVPVFQILSSHLGFLADIDHESLATLLL